jgi:PST family polysaccharide transporter
VTQKAPRRPDIGIIALVPDRWGPMWQPRHQIMSRLAQHFHVVWVEPVHGWREAGARLTAGTPAFSEPIPGFQVYTPEAWLPRFHRAGRLNQTTLTARLSRAKAELVRRGAQTIVLYLWRPEFAPAVHALEHDLLCYHIDDEYTFSDRDQPIDPREAELLSKADQVFIHSPALMEKKGHINPRTLNVPNGVDYAAFATPVAEPADLAGIPHPRIGYTGWVKRQLDWELIETLVGRHPGWQFVFVGATSPHPELAPILERLNTRSNVHLLGGKSTAELAEYPQHFDVCVMPYAVNDYTRYIYPLKLHEYLAAGRPVVGARIRSLEAFSRVVGIADGADEWSAAIEAGLRNGARGPERSSERQAVAREHDWDVLTRHVASAIETCTAEEDVAAGAALGPSVAAHDNPMSVPRTDGAGTSGVETADVETAGAARARDLDRSLIQGVAWTAGLKWVSQLFSWAATLIVARLLTREDYGLVAMATVFLGLITLINEFGLGAAVIKRRELGEREVAQLSGLCVIFGAVAFLVGAAAAVPLARFYDAPELVAVVLVLSTNFIITSFRTVPLALLQRDLRFRTVAINESVQAVVLAVAMVAFAVLGYRYWTLVIGGVLSGVLSTALAYFQRPHRLAWPRLREIGPSVTFGSHIVGGRIGWYVYQNADFLIAGKVLGQAALGAYSLAWTIASIPVEKVSAMVGRVAPGFFSAVQDDYPAVRRYLAQLTAGLALVTMPLAVGMALVAPEFVVVFLKAEWVPAIVPLQLLAVYASYRSIVTLIPHVAINVGLSAFSMRNSLIGAVVMPAAFIVGSRWGTAGIAGAWIVAYPFVTLPLYWAVFRRIEMPLAMYLTALWPAASSTGVMAVAVLGVRYLLPPDTGAGLTLLILSLTGAAAYTGSVFALHRGAVAAARVQLAKLKR